MGATGIEFEAHSDAAQRAERLAGKAWFAIQRLGPCGHGGHRHHRPDVVLAMVGTDPGSETGRAVLAQAPGGLTCVLMPRFRPDGSVNGLNFQRLQPLARFDLDAAILFSDILTVPDAMGLGLYFTEGEGPKFARPVRRMRLPTRTLGTVRLPAPAFCAAANTSR